MDPRNRSTTPRSYRTPGPSFDRDPASSYDRSAPSSYESGRIAQTWDNRWEEEPPAQPLRASWDPMAPESPRHEGRRAERSGNARRRSSLGWFVHRYGWRAYGIPVLAAATVLAVVQLTNPAEPATTPPPVENTAAGDSTTIITGETSVVTVTADPVTVTSAPSPAPTEPTDPVLSTAMDPNSGSFDLASAELPPGGDFTVDGDRTWQIVPGTTGVVGSGSQVWTYAIEIEGGVEVDGGPESFAAFVDSTLADPRSWTSSTLGDIALQRVDPASEDVDFRISLASQITIRELCGYVIQLEASCYNSFEGKVLINIARWVRGAVAYQGDVGSYRRYAINHEVGHALEFGHQPCGTANGLAPVMMQQSWGIANDDLNELDPNIPADGLVCMANPWPDPLAGEGTPTEE